MAQVRIRGGGRGGGRAGMPNITPPRGSLGRFTQSVRVQQTAAEIGTFAALVNPENVVEFHIPDPNGRTFRTLRSLLAWVEEEENDMQANAYAASYITFYLPDLVETAEGAFRDMGLTVQRVSTDEARLEGGMVLDQTLDSTDALVYLGQLILLLFKNVTNNNFTKFMSARCKALCAICGSDLDRMTVVCSLNRAIKIKAILGSSHEFKRKLTLSILRSASSNSKMGQFSSYLANILEYNEMAPLSFIYETLMLTRSPVLRDPEVRLEMIHLAEIFEMITSSDNPKYFRLLCTPEQARRSERSRYSIMAGLAQSIKSAQTDTVTNFVATQGPDHKVIARLRGIHDSYMQNLREIQSGHSVNFLMSDPNAVGGEDEEYHFGDVGREGDAQQEEEDH